MRKATSHDAQQVSRDTSSLLEFKSYMHFTSKMALGRAWQGPGAWGAEGEGRALERSPPSPGSAGYSRDRGTDYIYSSRTACQHKNSSHVTGGPGEA
jgi:hypothetical protein